MGLALRFLNLAKGRGKGSRHSSYGFHRWEPERIQLASMGSTSVRSTVVLQAAPAEVVSMRSAGAACGVLGPQDHLLDSTLSQNVEV
jgi:hypothetical protein